jgi:diketogulonate reductase-like aldo/keto reductase
MKPNKRRLGTTDLEITTVGFGARAIGGGGWAYGWGPQDDAGSIAAIRHAVHRGVNWVDTVAIYGLGHSEEAGSLDLDTSDLAQIAASIRLSVAGSGPVAYQWKGAA